MTAYEGTRMSRARSNPGVFLAVLFPAVWLRAETVVLPAVSDAGMRELVPSENSGSAPTIRVGTLGANGSFTRNRGLFRFDPTAAIPPGASIVSAQLTLHVSKAPSFNPPPVAFELRRLLVSWSESVATWQLREALGVTWNSPGGSAGVDFATDMSGTADVAGVGNYTWGSTTGLVADVQRWVDDPDSNYGWILFPGNESLSQSARLINTSESLASAPALTVEFALALPLRISSVGLSDNQLCLEFQASAGTAYVVERRAQVDSGAWTIVTNLPPAAADGPVTVCDSLMPSNGFYRVGQQ